jgi:hypothetical protein
MSDQDRAIGCLMTAPLIEHLTRTDAKAARQRVSLDESAAPPLLGPILVGIALALLMLAIAVASR